MFRSVTDGNVFRLFLSCDTVQMFVLCWMAVTLSALLPSAGSLSPQATRQLPEVVAQMLNR